MTYLSSRNLYKYLMQGVRNVGSIILINLPVVRVALCPQWTSNNILAFTVLVELVNLVAGNHAAGHS
eukprot:3109082-Ditylum_brightwellii.AAC.1